MGTEIMLLSCIQEIPEFIFRLRYRLYGQNYCDAVWPLGTDKASYFKLRHNHFLVHVFRCLRTTFILKAIIVITRTYSIVQ
jgi:hypothetical protein